MTSISTTGSVDRSPSPGPSESAAPHRTRSGGCRACRTPRRPCHAEPNRIARRGCEGSWRAGYAASRRPRKSTYFSPRSYPRNRRFGGGFSPQPRDCEGPRRPAGNFYTVQSVLRWNRTPRSFGARRWEHPAKHEPGRLGLQSRHGSAQGPASGRRRRRACRCRAPAQRAVVRLERRDQAPTMPPTRSSARAASPPSRSPQADHQGYYLGYANSVLWPVFHNRLDLAAIRGRLLRALSSASTGGSPRCCSRCCAPTTSSGCTTTT